MGEAAIPRPPASNQSVARARLVAEGRALLNVLRRVQAGRSPEEELPTDDRERSEEAAAPALRPL